MAHLQSLRTQQQPYVIFVAGQEKQSDAAMQAIARGPVYNVWMGRPQLDYTSWRGIVEDALLIDPHLRRRLKQVHLHHHVHSTHVPMLADLDWPPSAAMAKHGDLVIYLLIGGISTMAMAMTVGWWIYGRLKHK